MVDVVGSCRVGDLERRSASLASREALLDIHRQAPSCTTELTVVARALIGALRIRYHRAWCGRASSGKVERAITAPAFISILDTGIVVCGTHVKAVLDCHVLDAVLCQFREHAACRRLMYTSIVLKLGVSRVDTSNHRACLNG
jgi:hypothetical protein